MRLPSLHKFICVAAIAMSTAVAGEAHAKSPVIVPIDVHFVDDFSCSFPFNASLTGLYRQQVIGDRTHNVYLSTWTFVNPANGKTLSGQNHGPDKIIENPDGSVTIQGTGVFVRIVVPGAGVIAHRAGRFLIRIPADPTQPVDVLSESGPQNDQPSNMCPYLAD